MPLQENAKAPSAAAPAASLGSVQNCSQPVLDCGSGITASPEVFNAIRSGACDGRIPGSCIAGGSLVDQAYYEAVRLGNCFLKCSDEPQVCSTRVLVSLVLLR